MSTNDTYTITRFLTAGETDARGLMPVTLIAARAIEAATLHANALGIGYSNLSEHRLGWVLARLAIDVHRYPTINETYTLTTWIESYNKYFSDRCFVMTDESGAVVADIRSVWVAIDTSTRHMADLTQLDRSSFPTADRTCPVPKCRAFAIAPDSTVERTDYTFRFTDIDFNGHVNTVRYLEAVLNLRPLDFYKTHDIARLEASFEHECHFGKPAELVTGKSTAAEEAFTTEIHTEGRRAAAVQLTYRLR